MQAIRIDRTKPLAQEPRSGHNRYHPAIEPVAVRFLLSQYVATARADLSAIVGEALGRALQQHDAAASTDAEWLLLFVDACSWSEDERLRVATEQLLAELKRENLALKNGAQETATPQLDGAAKQDEGEAEYRVAPKKRTSRAKPPAIE